MTPYTGGPTSRVTMEMTQRVSWSHYVIRNSPPEALFRGPKTSSRPSSRRSRLSFGEEDRDSFPAYGLDRIIRQGIEFPLGSEFEELNETCAWVGRQFVGRTPEPRRRAVHKNWRCTSPSTYVIQQWSYAPETDITRGSQYFL